MLYEFKLPDIGEGVVEGELVKWLVEDGEAVVEDTPMFEVLTDKVSAVIPSPYKGVVAKRYFEEGDIVPVGGVVLAIEASGGAAVATSDTPEAPAAPAPEATTTAQPAAASAAAPVATATPSWTPATSTPANRVRATPATRKLARTLGVNIEQVEGTGNHGRVTREDVQKWAEGVAKTPATRAQTPAIPLAPNREDEVRKLLGMRRKISETMRYSRDTAAHFTYVDEVDFTEVAKLKDALRARGIKTTFLPFVMKAVATVLQRQEFELLNSHVNYDKGEILVKRSYHLGIAAATDAGLMVPVIFDVDRKNMRTLVEELNALGEGARDNKLAVSQLSGSTFTITSLGKLGGMFATPIINPPEVGILGLHKIEKRPVVVDGEIVIRDRMYMSCSFDHRLIDGHVGAAFVQAVKDLLESPALLLAELA